MEDGQNSDFEEVGQQAPAGGTESDNEKDASKSERNSATSETSVRSRPSAQPKQQKVKAKFAPREMVWRRYISKESLLPTVNDWVSEWNHHKRLRRLFILMNLSVCICLFISRIVSAAIIANHMKKIHSFTVIHTLPRDVSSVEQEETEKPHFLLNCAAVYPKWTGFEDWYTIEDIPYAALPRRAAVFARSAVTFTFKECYNAYWASVHPKKRAFVNGQLRFISSQSATGGDVCLQLDPENRRAESSASVSACLTLSLIYKHTLKKRGPGFIRTDEPSLELRPILVFVGGDSMLYNRPRLISPWVAQEMDFVYVAIRYRLGVFGFSDFQTDDAGPNHAVEDVKRALTWVYENAAHFGGDARQITLFGENSGATIAALLMNAQLETFETTNTSQPYLVSRLWLSDGGLVAPPKSSDLNPFQQLLLSDLELTEACFNQRRRGRVSERTNGSFSSISGKVVCLEGAIRDTTWLTKTPLAWINAQQGYMRRLPRADEERVSLLQEDLSISHVESPIGRLRDREALNVHFRDIPMVIGSTMDQVDLHMSRRNKPPAKNMTLLELQNEIRSSFSTLSSSTAQVNYVYSISKAYDPLLRTLSKTQMGEAFNAIISDLRSICAYNIFAKRLQQFGFVKESPIYRLLNRLPRPPLRDIRGRFCDIPFFLNDGRTGCECRNTDISRWETLRSQSPVLRPILKDFVHTGWIRKLKRMRVPSNPAMPAIETTFNIMGPQGLVTAGGREVSSYTACSEWRVPDEIHVLLKYGRVN
uniref:Neurotactin n=1 Tax=Schistocephalus solidus TaxID=70667 RepID=A0A0X3PJZ9_SCHSO